MSRYIELEEARKIREETRRMRIETDDEHAREIIFRETVRKGRRLSLEEGMRAPNLAKLEPTGKSYIRQVAIDNPVRAQELLSEIAAARQRGATVHFPIEGGMYIEGQ